MQCNDAGVYSVKVQHARSFEWIPVTSHVLQHGVKVCVASTQL